MRKIILIVTLVLITLNSFAQNNNYPKGMYMSFDEIINKSPSENFTVELEKRTQGKIKMNGGNDYQLNSVDKSVKRKVLFKNVLAYSDETDLYLNCFIYRLQRWYSKILSDKKYFVFKAGIPFESEKFGYKLSELTKGKFIGFGGALTGMKLALLRFPYVLNKSTQELNLVTDKNIRNFISENEELLKKYEKETEKNDLEMILNYLIEWNETTE